MTGQKYITVTILSISSKHIVFTWEDLNTFGGLCSSRVLRLVAVLVESITFQIIRRHPVNEQQHRDRTQSTLFGTVRDYHYGTTA